MSLQKCVASLATLPFLITVVFMRSASAESSNYRLKRNGPFSEHGKLCGALWRPHLTDPLGECDLLRSRCSEKEFTCIKGYCCPSKKVVCTMPTESGHELQADKHYGRYAYNEELGACIKFSYFGKAGNFNNFLTHRDCIQYCHSYRNSTTDTNEQLN